MLFVQVESHSHFLLKGLETRRLEAQELLILLFIYSTNDYLQIEYAERQQGRGSIQRMSSPWYLMCTEQKVGRWH